MIFGLVGLFCLVSAADSALSERRDELRSIVEERMRSGDPSSLMELRQEQTQLDTTLMMKCDSNCKQDKKIKDLQENLTMGYFNLERIHKNYTHTQTAIIEPTEKGMQSLTIGIDASLASSTTAWQALANEIRDIILKRQDNTGDLFNETETKLKETFHSIAAIFLFQQKHFKDIVEDINKEKNTTMTTFAASATPVQKEVAASAKALRLSNKKLTGQGRKMSKVLQKEMQKSQASVMRKVGAMNKMIDGIMEDAQQTVDKQLKDAKEVKIDMKGVGDKLIEMQEKTRERFQKIQEESGENFTSHEKRTEKLTDRHVDSIDKITYTMSADLKELSKAILKGFRDLDKKNTGELKGQTKASKRASRSSLRSLTQSDKS